MKKLIIYCCLAFVAINVQAQEEVIEEQPIFHDVVPVPETPTVQEDDVFKVVEDMPVFPGGEAALMKYLASIQYPAEALKNKQQGTTYLSLIIEKDGSISNVVVSRSAGYEGLDKAALEHVAAMPRWKPGYQRGKPVRVSYIIPIKFKLDK